MTPVAEVIDEAQGRMMRIVEEFQQALTALHGRPSPALLDRIRVHAYGEDVPLSHVATVTVQR